MSDSQDIDQSIEKLASGMRRVARGDFNIQLETTWGDPLRDIIVDFNRMAESLLGVESLRESFVSNVAHEFKTPLAYIQGYATLLQDEDLAPDERKEYIRHIVNATNRLSNMIGNLLEISNLSRPGSRLEMERFSLDEQLRHVMALFVPQMERKGVTYEIDLAELDVEGNESLLEDAWTNLISNAVKYTPAGGMVSVSLERQYNLARVMVSDTGCGMDENQAQHAFDRFYQGDDSHVSEGSGLGLAIVRAVVKKHQGSINLKSAPGQGTAFTVILPMVHDER